MQDKNLIILGLILAIIFGGGIWYYGQKTDSQEAVISEGLIPEEEGLVEKSASVSQEAAEKTAEATEEELEFFDANLGEFVLGYPEAPITMIEYFSYGCSHCQRFNEDTLPLIKEKYIETGKVKLIVRQLFGIPDLPQAALCAGEQNKFWAYHGYLFGHLQDLKSKDDLKVFAESLGLDRERFDQCLDSEKYKEKIEQWAQEGRAKGLQGVPSFFINDQKIVGAQPFSEFEAIIEQILAQ
jgi:protein-disulfide isomerase